jgi:nitrite reductase/ring-hydroxylating ferredoxin subunit
MEFVSLARREEVPVGEARLFGEGQFRVLLTRIEDEIYALQPTCPHKGCEWDGAKLLGEVLFCPRCHFRYSARTGLNPLTTACHVNQSTAEYHYRNFPEGKADLFEVRTDAGAVAVATTPKPFQKVIV